MTNTAGEVPFPAMANERVIVVGAGGISNAWLPPLKAEGVEVVAIVDLRAEAARAQIGKYELSGTIASDDLDKVLNDVDADFLLDLTVPEAHCEVTCKALRAGLHVLGEKPMAATMTEARKMVRTAEQTGKTYMVDQSRRWEKNHDIVAKTLASGTLGRVTTINCDFFLAAHFGGFRDRMDSPLILDMAIHHFDMARLFSQRNAVAVYAEEFNPPGSWYKGAPAANCLFELERGIRFTYRGSWCSEGCHTQWAGDWRIIGENGTLIFRKGEVTGETVAGNEGFTRPVKPLETVASDLQHESMHGALQEMLRFLRTRKKPQTDCHDNIHSLAMVHAAIRSSKAGKRVQLRV
jgi:predicted dehydrogenase